MKGVSKVSTEGEGGHSFSVSMLLCVFPSSPSFVVTLLLPSSLHFHLAPFYTSHLPPPSTLFPGDGKDERPAEASRVTKDYDGL